MRIQQRERAGLTAQEIAASLSTEHLQEEHLV